MRGTLTKDNEYESWNIEINTITNIEGILKSLFFLGEVIISDTDIVVPYSSIVKYGVLLIIPLSIGILINRYTTHQTDRYIRDRQWHWNIIKDE